MKKSEFIEAVTVSLESLQIEVLANCYDITTYVHDLVDNMTSDNDLEWDKEDDSE